MNPRQKGLAYNNSATRVACVTSIRSDQKGVSVYCLLYINVPLQHITGGVVVVGCDVVVVGGGVKEVQSTQVVVGTSVVVVSALVVVGEEFQPI